MRKVVTLLGDRGELPSGAVDALLARSSRRSTRDVAEVTA
jgi:hypothetical protein